MCFFSLSSRSAASPAPFRPFTKWIFLRPGFLQILFLLTRWYVVHTEENNCQKLRFFVDRMNSNTLFIVWQDRPPTFNGHPAVVFLHITLLMMDSFDQVLMLSIHISSTKDNLVPVCFFDRVSKRETITRQIILNFLIRTRWPLQRTCSWPSTGETTDCAHLTTWQRITGDKASLEELKIWFENYK